MEISLFLNCHAVFTFLGLFHDGALCALFDGMIDKFCKKIAF